MKKIAISTIMLTFISLSLVSVVLPVYAANPSGEEGQFICPIDSKAYDSRTDCNTACKTTGDDPRPVPCSVVFSRDIIAKLINTYKNWFLMIAGLIVAFVFIFAAILFMTAGGNEDRRKKARQWLIWGVVGLVVLAFAAGLMYTVQNLLLPD